MWLFCLLDPFIPTQIKFLATPLMDDPTHQLMNPTRPDPEKRHAFMTRSDVQLQFRRRKSLEPSRGVARNLIWVGINVN